MSKSSDFIYGFGLEVATALRATEAFQPTTQRIYDAQFDYAVLHPLTRLLLLPGVRHVIIAALEKWAMGTPGMLLCRSRFIDDALAVALKEGAAQVVSFGAGFDTRAYRIPGIEKTQCFELDLPEPQRYKKSRLKKYFGALPGHVTYISIDFDRQDIAAELAAAGFQEGVMSFFVWEGVTQYITAEAVDDTLGVVGRAGPGSRIAFTYIVQGIIDGAARSVVDQRIMARVARRGMPWVFGLQPEKIDSWLANRGFRTLDRADAVEYRVRYAAPVGRDIAIYEGEQMVLAEVAR